MCSEPHLGSEKLPPTAVVRCERDDHVAWITNDVLIATKAMSRGDENGRFPEGSRGRIQMTSAPTVPEVAIIEPQTTAVIRGVVTVNRPELSSFFDRAFRRLPATIAAQGVRMTGPAFSLHRRPPAETMDLEVGFPTDQPITPAGEVVPSSLPGGRVARVVHYGSYDGLSDSWEQLRRWIEDNGFRTRPLMWEFYLTEPSPTVNPDDLRTELFWPLSE